jgi:hypothetical protein
MLRGAPPCGPTASARAGNSRRSDPWTHDSRGQNPRHPGGHWPRASLITNGNDAVVSRRHTGASLKNAASTEHTVEHLLPSLPPVPSNLPPTPGAGVSLPPLRPPRHPAGNAGRREPVGGSRSPREARRGMRGGGRNRLSRSGPPGPRSETRPTTAFAAFPRSWLPHLIGSADIPRGPRARPRVAPSAAGAPWRRPGSRRAPHVGSPCTRRSAPRPPPHRRRPPRDPRRRRSRSPTS